MDDTVRSILTKKISENNWLDYKIQEYDSSDKSRSKLLKEVIGMLNSEESYGKDKFIIMGVADENLYVKGIANPKDDNEYQNVFDCISPRPCIEKGVVIFNGKNISYLHISKSNIDRPYVIGKEKNLGAFSLSQGASFIRKGTKNYPLKETERLTLTFNTMKYRPGETKLVQQINASIRLKESEFRDENLSGCRTINPEQNNGKFVFGFNEYEFTIKLQSASNNIGRMYSDCNDIKIGKVTKRDNLIKSFNQSNDQVDFSSRVVDLHFNEVGIAVNQFGKIIFIETLTVESQSHGKVEDKITFKWQIVDYDI